MATPSLGQVIRVSAEYLRQADLPTLRELLTRLGLNQANIRNKAEALTRISQQIVEFTAKDD